MICTVVDLFLKAIFMKTYHLNCEMGWLLGINTNYVMVLCLM